MNIEIITIGTEILLGDITNTNSRHIASGLAEMGFNVYYHTTVGDNLSRIVECFQHAFIKADMIITTGGLGPTVDDLTRDAVASYFGVGLEQDEKALQDLNEFFSKRGWAVSPSNLKQASFPAGSVVLPNPQGTAPGFIATDGNKTIISLPGPPREMKAMFAAEVIPYLQKFCDGVIVSRICRVIGLGESTMADMVADLIEQHTNPTIAPYASEGTSFLRLTAKASDIQQANALLDPLCTEIARRMGENLYGYDDDTPASGLLNVLSDRGFSLAVAESCTGGMLSSMIVDCPGASAHYRGGVIAYDNNIKTDVLGVQRKTLDQYGAVSGEVALEMARGVQKHCGSDCALAVTGVAGPDGGTPDKPVGTVWLGYVYPGGEKAVVLNLHGDRSMIRLRASLQGLDQLRRIILQLK